MNVSNTNRRRLEQAIPSLLVLAAALLLTAWVQRHSVGAFFTSPDDLVHLQQAYDLLPTPPTPFRFLSQVLYFRLMVHLFGLDPLPFHLATYATHLLNVSLFFLLLRSWRVPSPVAGLAAALFGSMPLCLPLLSSAVGMNDELSFSLSLLALLTFGRHQRAAPALSTFLFLLGLLCKESVLFIPALVLIARPATVSLPAQARRAWPLLLALAAAVPLFFFLRLQGLAPDRVVYAMGLGPNIVFNLATYTAWAVDLARPLPDLVSSYDPGSLPVALPILGLLGLAFVTLRGERRAIGLGLCWWLLGLAPVLALESQTYRHYMYPALPGLALAVSGAVAGTLEGIRSAAWAGHAGGRRAWPSMVLAVCAVAYSVRADSLISQRLRLRVPVADIAADPVVRRSEMAEHALASIGSTISSARTKIGILFPPGIGVVVGTRSGNVYRKVPSGQRPYNLLAEAIDKGRAVRLFFPQVDTVLFIDRWSPAYGEYHLFLPATSGYLIELGRGPEAHLRAARLLSETGNPAATRAYLDPVVQAYPEHGGLALAHALAVVRSGDSVTGWQELRDLAVRAPRDPAGMVAHRLLGSRDDGRPASGRASGP